MRRALRLAQRGRGRTSPNPPVGALVVVGDEVVGEGSHERAGLPHAEVIALQQAGERARGATLYLTLEPCTRHGRTPPCAPSVVASGVGRVVIASLDPSEGGAGASALAEAGIEVRRDVLGIEAAELIAGFTTRVATGRPLVTVKLALSLDGRAAAADGSSRWITGPTARRDVHRLRASTDAVMAGIGTVIADDPQLTCRLRGYDGSQPLRVVLDSSLRVPHDARVLADDAPTLVATTAKAPEDALDAVRARGAEVVRFPSRDGRVDVVAVLEELGRRGLNDVLVEGGPTLAGEMIERGLVDRYTTYLAPKLLGQLGTSAIAGLIVPNIADARELTITSVRRIGADIRVDARPRI
jgi:diaminohydroxyphosphoribosylaminopyrimidine deaminase/5-amino-6-(5-phosphoribosylamino)uracil reductase